MKRIFAACLSAMALFGLVSCEKSGAYVPETFTPTTIEQTVWLGSNYIDETSDPDVWMLAFATDNEVAYWEGKSSEFSREEENYSKGFTQEDIASMPEGTVVGTYTYVDGNGSMVLPTGVASFSINKNVLTLTMNGEVKTLEQLESEPDHPQHPDYPNGGDDWGNDDWGNDY